MVLNVFIGQRTIQNPMPVNSEKRKISIDKTVRGAYNCKSNKNHRVRSKSQWFFYTIRNFFNCANVEVG